MFIVGQLCIVTCCLHSVVQADGVVFSQNIADCVAGKTENMVNFLLALASSAHKFPCQSKENTPNLPHRISTSEGVEATMFKELTELITEYEW